MSSLPASAYPLPVLLDAWESTLRSVAALGSRLTARQWEAATDCPGWSTGDVVRHLAWIESFLAGRRDPEHAMDWELFPHVDGDFSRLTETGVDVRRGLSQVDACVELETVTDVRLAQIMALEPLTLETEVIGVFGRPVPLETLLRIRIFDSWTHLQDIRRAAGLPGDLATTGAQVSALQLARSTPFVLARNVGAPAGTTMRVAVTGPIAFEQWAGVDDDLRGVDVDGLGRPEAPTIAIGTDWETYARLGAGRLDVDDPAVLERVTLSGDAVLAARIPEALAITP